SVAVEVGGRHRDGLGSVERVRSKRLGVRRRDLDRAHVPGVVDSGRSCRRLRAIREQRGSGEGWEKEDTKRESYHESLRTVARRASAACGVSGKLTRKPARAAICGVTVAS